MATAIVSAKQIASDPSASTSQLPKQLLSSNYAQTVAQQTAENGQRANKLSIDVSDHRTQMINSGGEVFRFKIGDLVWAKVNNHPWWPCRISNDLNESFFRYEGIISFVLDNIVVIA